MADWFTEAAGFFWKVKMNSGAGSGVMALSLLSLILMSTLTPLKVHPPLSKWPNFFRKYWLPPSKWPFPFVAKAPKTEI